jgi:hypothetical protein
MINSWTGSREGPCVWDDVEGTADDDGFGAGGVGSYADDVAVPVQIAL